MAFNVLNSKKIADISETVRNVSKFFIDKFWVVFIDVQKKINKFQDVRYTYV